MQAVKSPIYQAALTGDLEAIKKLKKQGLNLDEKDTNGNSILHFAAISRSSELMNYILNEHPALINQGNNLGETPLHFTATQKDYGVFNFLTRHNAQPLQKDSKGIAPLAILCKMIQSRDPLNFSNFAATATGCLILRLIVTSYYKSLNFPDSTALLNCEFQKHSLLFAIDLFLLSSTAINFLTERATLDFQEKSLSTYATTCAAIPGIKSLKACWESVGIRDSKKILASAIVNTLGLVTTAQALYRSITLFHFTKASEAKKEALEDAAYEQTRKFENEAFEELKKEQEQALKEETAKTTLKEFQREETQEAARIRKKQENSDLSTACVLIKKQVFNLRKKAEFCKKPVTEIQSALTKLYKDYSLNNHPDKSKNKTLYPLVNNAFQILRKTAKTNPKSVKANLCSP